ncbi:non-ribosomal peptide synthetase [Brevibacterium sp. UCMA 11752]|uniref:non-ribosomal peptide synthetase n=1 Tax=Brevibacterium sp. UCMA 11752 TaxID=2745946 RepID=UPI001F3030D5|nr:non-ribosomal peptide synthetase [Brevibacterium sp. UCMA 11752]MCF2587137.1 amino acid adenylation domain-containing protein [Brevibacterium sp. UCMA 11752]
MTEDSPRIELTSAQRGIWYAQKIEPDNPTFQIGLYVEILGPLDVDVMRRAVGTTVAEADSLNVVFGEDEQGVFQKHGSPRSHLHFHDLRGGSVDESMAKAQALMEADLATVHDLETGELLRSELFHLGEDHWIFYQRAHHLLVDGYSAVLVLRRESQLYGELADPAAQPSDSPFGSLEALVAEEADYRASQRFRTDADFWSQTIAESETATGLAGRPPASAKQLVTANADIPPELARQLASAQSAPTLILAAAATYLHRMTGRKTVSVGLPVTARRSPLAKSVPSMMSKILPLQLTTAPETTFPELLESTGSALRSTLIHQRFQYQELDTDTSYIGPSVNIFPAVDDISFGQTQASLHLLSTGPVDDLSIIVHGLGADQNSSGRDSRTAIVRLEANAELYSQESLADHLGRFLSVLAQLEPGHAQLEPGHAQSLAGLSLLDDSEADEVIAGGQGRIQDIPHHTVVDEFVSHAHQTPFASAVVADDGHLSFCELDRRSTQLACHLRQQGAGPGTRVAARIGRTTAMPVAVLGVLKAGAAFVPLDPDHPAARIEAMVADAAPALVLNSSSVPGPDGETTILTDRPVIDLDSDVLAAALSSRTSQTVPGATPAPDDLAYVIFTSGSTGRPKGIGVEHQSLLNLFLSHQETIFAPAVERLGRGLRVAHTAGISFDAAWDPLLWLFAGHELHLIDSLTRRDPEALTAYFTTHGIDSIETTPSFIKALLAHSSFGADGHPSVVALGGEAVDSGLWKQLAAREGMTSYNLYGPAETTVDSLTATIAADTSPILGQSVTNTRHYVLDSRLAPVPEQATGELYIAGLNLARGYVDRPGTTSERFVADPFADDGSRMYRTGDIVRRPLNGGIEFLGRADEQIKLRGYRVELSEVELALQSDPRISSAVVELRQNQAGYAQLLGFVTSPSQLDTAEVRRSMKARVPDYMVPSFIMQIESIPLTVNGKLDRQALPEPESARSESEAPRDSQERIVAEAFSDVLGIDSVGIDDDFFELGGHSLLATQLVASLRTSFATAPALREVFQHPTVRELSACFDPKAITDDSGHELVAADRPTQVPLSYAQARLWFINQFDPSSAAYNIPLTLRMRGRLDVNALQSAINDVIARHESLRTVFPWTAGQPEQVILNPANARIAMSTVGVSEGLVHHTVEAEATRGFDVSRELPIRALLIRLSEDDHVLLLTLHHIAADGWSLGPLARDLSTAYRARGQGRAPAFPPLPVQYADYALWQRETLGTEDDPNSALSHQLAFWKESLADAPSQLRLPADRSRDTQIAGSVSRAIPVDISPTVHAGLRRLSSERNASLFMVLQAAFAVLLDKLGAGSDIPIGTPVAGRTETKLDELVGFFVNTLVLRTDTSGNPSAADVIDRVRGSNLAAYANQDAPFERVVDELDPPRSEGLHPLFQVMLTLQNTAPVDIDMGDLNVEPDSGPQVSEAKFDLLLDLAERRGEAAGISGSLEFDSALFDDSTARGIAARFVAVLEQFAAEPNRLLSDVEVLSQPELDTLREESRGADRERVETTIIDALDTTVHRQPERTALVAEGTELSFAELGDRVHRYGRALSRRGIGPGQRVAIALPRSADAIIVPLAVLSIGAIAVPIDLSYPQERIRLILDVSDPVAVVIDSPDVPVRAGTAISTADLHADPAFARGDDYRPNLDDRAYEMYTSGSTGTPKGVAVPHRGLANLLAHHRETIFAEAGLGEESIRVAHTAGLGFDAAWDPVLWLVAGASLHIVDEDVRRDAEALVEFCRVQQIDALETTPSFVRQLIASGLLDHIGTLEHDADRVDHADGRGEAQHRKAPVLTIALGGEPVPDDLWRELAQHAGARAYNFYGPTEFTVDSVIAKIEGEHTTIGRPVRNVQALVLDQHLREVAHGVVGELYLAGDGIATGYVNRMAETSLRFVANPLGDGERMYRTGDLVRRTSDGRLDFISRDDDQIKLRGYRIELGDVENALTACQGVEQAAAVVDNPQDPQSARLLGYYAGDVEESAIRDHLVRWLPAPMVPRVLIPVDSIPLTSHGKLDRSRLPAPNLSGARSSRAAQTPDERTMCEQFSLVLEAEHVGLDDDFFELGGHSLLAVSLIGHIREAFDADLPLRTIFDAPTPAALLGRLDGSSRSLPAGLDEGRSARTEEVPTADPGATSGLRLSEWKRSSQGARPHAIPLSFGQARMHFLNQLDTRASDYTISLAARFEGDLDPDILAQALNEVITRHEILRTIYPTIDGSPVQHILPPEAGHGILDRRTTPSPAATTEEMAREAARGFDLSTDLPLRAVLFAEGDQWVLHLIMHHIATDGASLAPLTQDLATAYAALRGSAQPMRRKLDVQYADFALWQRHVLETQTLVGDDRPLLEHRTQLWSDRLAGIPSETPLPSDHPRPHTARQAGRHHHFHLDDRTTQRLTAIAAEAGASLFMALHAVLAGFLSRVGGSEDVVIGSPSAGRSDPELEDMVGLFVNTVPIRTDVSSQPDFHTLLARTRTAVIDALELDDVPFERLVEAINPPRVLGRHPLFQTMLSLENTASPLLDLPGVDTSIEPEVETGDAKFDLSFTFRRTASGRSTPEPGLDVVLDYNSSMFEAATISDMCENLSRFVAELVQKPERSISDICLLETAEVTHAIDQLAGPVSSGSLPMVLDVFATTVRQLPDSTAVESAETSLTFRELDEASDLLARELLRFGAGPGSTVSVRLSRGVGIIVATLAVLKSGAADNPIDIDYPAGRTTAIMADATPSIVLAETGTAEELAPVLAEAGIAPPIVEISALDGTVDDARSTWPWSGSVAAPPEQTPPAGQLDPAAYVTFTSGSTGRPKGVEVGHDALANLLASHRATYLPTPATAAEQITVAHTTGVGFDAAWDPLLWMMVGHRVHITSTLVQRDPQQLARLLRDLRIGFWETTPSYLRQLRTEPDFLELIDQAARADAPVTLALGGEAIDEDLWGWLRERPGISAYNLYGPTETTVDAFAGPVAASATPVLGSALQHMRGYVLDERLHHVPAGTTGELYLAGHQLAHGYRGRSGLSAERFVSDPYGEPGERMYRTGDLVVRHHNGDLGFLGRSDNQIQLRGFRVELGEVERALRSAPNVKDALVRPFGADAATMALVGYVVATGTNAPGARESRADLADEARRHVRSMVPNYMVPPRIVVIDEIPLTAHGKIDESALPDPSQTEVGSRSTPRTPLQETVAAIFADVLSLPRVGIDESFFELGGHSFLARPLIAAVNEALGAELSVQSLFRSPTVEQLVAEAGQENADSVRDSLQRLLPLRTTGTKAPLFTVHPATGISWGFATMLHGLDAQRPLIGLQMPGLAPEDPEQITAHTLTELADDYITQMRSVQPEGPYHLLGWSFGGILAHRLAARLQELGEDVAFLGILDAFPDGQGADDMVVGPELWADYLGANHPGARVGTDDLDDEGVLEVLRELGDPLGNVSTETMTAMTDGFFTMSRLIRESPAETFAGDVVVFTATQDVPPGTPTAESWRPYVTGHIHVTEVPARHADMLTVPALREILPVMAIHLDDDAEPQT